MKENTKRQTEAQTANESRKKRKMSQNAKKASGFDIVGKEAITQINNLMIPKYWLVNYDGTNFVMNVKHNGHIFQGKGLTIEMARQDAAKTALKAFV